MAGLVTDPVAQADTVGTLVACSGHETALSATGFEKVAFKVGQAERAFESLLKADRREAFYDALSLFLSATRSAVMVLQFQCGLSEFEKGEKLAGTSRHLSISATERQQRQAFDRWFRKTATAVVEHPLKNDRDSDIHREGASSARFRLPPGEGVLLEAGGPIRTPFVMSSSNPWGLPLNGPRPEDFFFEFDRARPALDVCRDYLDLVRALVLSAQARPW